MIYQKPNQLKTKPRATTPWKHKEMETKFEVDRKKNKGDVSISVEEWVVLFQ
jgi:hypothetical protein